MRKIGQYDEEYVRRQTPLGAAAKIGGVILALCLVIGGISWGISWLRAGADVIGPDNVKSQFRFAYDGQNAMAAAAQNWCSLRDEELRETDASARAQRTSQRLAVETNYARIKGEYDAKMQDAFRAKYVKPADVPRTAPNLQQKVTEVGCAPATPAPTPTS